jgi:hypothetical protein
MTPRQGLSVTQCPDFIVKLHNRSIKSEFKIVSLPHPSGYKQPKVVKVYLVRKKGMTEGNLEGKFAKFFRSLS